MANARLVRIRMVAALGALVLVATVVCAAAPAGAATGSADLGLTLTSATPTIEGYGPVRYTAKVTNAGPDSAADVAFVVSSSFGYPSTPVTTTKGTCNPANSGVVSCRVGTLASGASATVTFGFQAYNVGVLALSAGVTSSTADPVAGNNISTATVISTPGPTFQDQLTKGYFQALLGRPPSAAELATWSPRLFGIPLADWVRQLTATSTYQARWVDQQFRRYLGRPANGGGSYVAFLRGGGTYDQVVARLVSSSEFARSVTSHCDGTLCVDFAPSAWLDKAYRALTGDPMPSALQADYLRRYGAGPRYAAALAIIRSGEGRRRFVDATTRTWLKRKATNFEIYVHVASMLKGQSAERTEAAILAQPDFYRPFTPGSGCCPVYD